MKLESDTEYPVANWTELSEASQPYTQIAFFPFKRLDYWGGGPKLDKQASDGTGHPPAVRIGGDSGYMQGSLGGPLRVCLPLCLVSSFLFRSRLRVAPFFCLPSGCCRNTRSLCDWLKLGSF